MKAEITLLQESLGNTERRLAEGELREKALLHNLEDIALRLEAAATKAMAPSPASLDKAEAAPGDGAPAVDTVVPAGSVQPPQSLPATAPADGPMILVPLPGVAPAGATPPIPVPPAPAPQPAMSTEPKASDKP